MNHSHLGLPLVAIVLALGCSPRNPNSTPPGNSASRTSTASAAVTTLPDDPGPSPGGGFAASEVQPEDSAADTTADGTPSTRGTGPSAAQVAPSLSPPRNGTSDEIVSITFDDLKTEMPPDSKFEPSMLPDKAARLDGRRVRIRGFIFPSIMKQDGIDEFPLVMNTQCKFGPGGQAHCIIMVELTNGVTTSFTVRPVAVEGRLTVQPWEGPDGNTWSLYHMLGERVD